MTLHRGLWASAVFVMVLIVGVAVYYFGTRAQQPVAGSEIEASTCGAFAHTYEHNSSEPDHIHITNLYGVNADGNHTHITRDYLDWLKTNLTVYVPADQTDQYRDITSAKLAGMLYSLYRWCRATPMDPFVSAIPAVTNKLPVPATYVEGQDGE